MKIKILSTLIFFLPLSVICQKAVSISLQAAHNNKNVNISWQYNENIINNDNFHSAILYRKNDDENNYNIISVFQNYLSNNYDDDSVNLSLKGYTYKLAILKNNSNDTIFSDPICPIFLTIKDYGGGNRNPNLSCPYYKDSLIVYRKYSYENHYSKIIKFLPPEKYQDTTITICNDTISYFVTNCDSTSISAKKANEFSDSNNPKFPIIRSLSIYNDNSLILKWSLSPSKDVFYYMLHTQNTNSDSWKPFNNQHIDATETSFTFDSEFCSNFNENNYSIYLKKFMLFAYDSCDNPSKFPVDTNNIVFPPILYDIKFDGCNTLTLFWNNYKSIEKNINKYIIEYKNDNYNGKIYVTNIDSLEKDSIWFKYNLNLTSYNDLLSNTTTYFRIISTNDIGDTSFTCWKEKYITQISYPPEFSNIKYIGSSINNNICINSVKIKIDSKPKSEITYSLLRIYDTTPTEIWSLEDFPIDNNIIDISDTINYPNGAYTYQLDVTDHCDNILGNSAVIKSLYLTGHINDNINNSFILSCNSLTTNQYLDIKYFIIMQYKDNIETTGWDIEYEQEYNYNINFYDDGSFSPISWHIEAYDKDNNIIAKSNTITYTPDNIELKIPNTFLPNSEHEINRRFGPMNHFAETSIKLYNLQIFNIYGNRIWWTDTYSAENDGNNDISRWNGRDKNSGRDVVNGTYVYILSIEFHDSNRPPLKAKGTITLLRE